jgi:hypothetical protein
MFLEGNENTPGVITVGGYNTTVIPTGNSGSIVKITFRVIANCDPCDGSHLAISGIVDDIVNMNVYCGTFTCPLPCTLGDVNEDGAITPGDALCAFNIFLNNGVPPTGECDTPCALYAADANCDGAVTPGDALLIFQAFLSGTPLQCPAMAKANSAVSATISIDDIAGVAGDIIRVPLMIDNPEGISAFGFDLSYPADLLTFKSISRTAITNDWVALDGNATESNQIKVGGFHTDAISTNKAAAIAEIIFVVKEGATSEGLLDITNTTDDFAQAHINSGAFSNDKSISTPSVYKLDQNFPNPFNMDTEFSFQLPAAVNVKFSIYNISGQKIRTLINVHMEAGTHKTHWDGRDDYGQDMASGIYVYKLETADVVLSKKMILLK